MRRPPGMVLAAVLGLAVGAAWVAAERALFDPHGDPESGAFRVLTDPPSRGGCAQCHEPHAEDAEPSAKNLFTENTNRLAFWTRGARPCHQSRPVNYPLGESDRIPDTEPDAGYIEANSGGARRVGVEFRGRWPGAAVYTNPRVTAAGRYYSPHARDPDMPRRDPGGEGLCLNCHDPHGTPGRDLLRAAYGGIAGHGTVSAPLAYRLCFTCHGRSGPAGMEPENRLIEDYYDSGINGRTAGHQIRKNPAIALYWPPHIQVGDKLPCYDCHNPHGSEGNNRVQPNAFVISDQRRGWSGLTDPAHDPEQNRRFCFGCHIPADGIPGSQTVSGIVMNTLPDRSEHQGAAKEACNDCHGRDYSSSTAHNVHNPARGDGLGGPGIGW